jgi:hypothetical protein
MSRPLRSVRGIAAAIWLLCLAVWMLAIEPLLSPARVVVKFMEGRLPDPELDSEKVGLTLVSVTYGVALGSVFTATIHGYNLIEAPGWSQLGVAAAAVILSWIGFHNNRATYPVWKARFINIPFLQYLISVGVSAVYFGFVATAEGLPGQTSGLASRVGGLPEHSSVTLAGVGKYVPSARPETLLIFLMFAAYLVWDVLEGVVVRSALNPNGRYQRGLANEFAANKKSVRRYLRSDVDRFDDAQLQRLVKRARVGAIVTAIFFLASAIEYGSSLTFSWNPSNRWTVVGIDCVYIAMLLIYRIAQEWSRTTDSERTRA